MVARPETKRVRFAADEAGSIDVSGYLLMVTILGIGIIVGLATVRDQVVQEFGDLSLALENIKQSYSITINGTTSEFVDDGPGDDPGASDDDNPADTPDAEPAGISIQQPAVEESAEAGGTGEEEG